MAIIEESRKSTKITFKIVQYISVTINKAEKSGDEKMRKVLFLIVLVYFTCNLFGYVEVAYCKAGAYDMGRQYIGKLEQNQLDRDYQIEFNELNHSTRFSTAASVDLEAKYINLWDVELNSVYNKLLAKLSDSQKDLLVNSQIGWLQFHTDENQLVATFPFGSQGRVSRLMVHRSRLRDRTLELMEYYVRLGGSVEFEYKGAEKTE
jgi:uncharacterized protein YecT (DUF1311 family)